MTISPVNERVEKHRAVLRRFGLRLVQFWVPDTHRPDFGKACRLQSLVAAQADAADAELGHFMDEALADLDGWKE